MEWVHVSDLVSQYKLAQEDVMLYVGHVLSSLGFQGQQGTLTAELVPPRCVNSSEDQASAFLGYGEVLEPVDKAKTYRNTDVDAARRPEQMGTLSTGNPVSASGVREAASSFPAQSLETVEQSVEQYIAACKLCLTGERLEQALNAKRAQDGDAAIEEESENAELTSRSSQVDQVAALVLLQGDRVLCRYTADGTVYLFAETLRPLTGQQYTAWLQRHNSHQIDVRRAKKKGKSEEDLLSHKSEMERIELKEGVEGAVAALSRALEPWLAGRAIESEILRQLPALVKKAPETSYRFFSAVNEAGQSRRPTAPHKTTRYLLWVLQLPETIDFNAPAADPLAASASLRLHPGYLMQFLQPTTSDHATPEALKAGQAFLPTPLQQVDAEDLDKRFLPSLLCSMKAEHFMDGLGRHQPKLATSVRSAIHVHAADVEVREAGVAEAFVADCSSHFSQLHPAGDAMAPDKEAQRSTAMESFIDEAAREQLCLQLRGQALDYSKKAFTQLRVGADVFYLLQSLKKKVETRLLRGLHTCVRSGDLLAIYSEASEPVLWMEVKSVKRLPSYLDAAREFGDLIYPGLQEMSSEEVDRLFFELHANSMQRRDWEAFFRKPGDRIVCWSVEPAPPDSIKPTGGRERAHIEAVNRIKRINAAARQSDVAVVPGRGARQLARLAAALVDKDVQVRSSLASLRLRLALRNAFRSVRLSRLEQARKGQGASEFSGHVAWVTRIQAWVRGVLARRRAALLKLPLEVTPTTNVDLEDTTPGEQGQHS